MLRTIELKILFIIKYYIIILFIVIVTAANKSNENFLWCEPVV